MPAARSRRRSPIGPAPLNGVEFFELPTDFPRKSTQGSTGAIQSQLLDRNLTDRLAIVARQNGCTLFMLAYAALVTLLHRYTGATDIAVGTQVAGRDQVETENLVGLFVNTLVLRADLTGEPSFAALLDRARSVIADALEHEAMPLEKVIEVLTPKRHPGHNAVFSVNFIYQRSFIENADYGTFRLVDLPSWSAGAMHDLNFFMVERPEGWRLSCEYNTGLYLQASIERLLAAFRQHPICDLGRPDAAHRGHPDCRCERTPPSGGRLQRHRGCVSPRPDVPASLRASGGGDARRDRGCCGRAITHLSASWSNAPMRSRGA